MAERAVVVGSGAGGGIAAMVLAEAGWDVLVLEKGPSHFADLSAARPASAFANDELKGHHRWFEYPDPVAEPRVFRTPDPAVPQRVGFVNALPATVGGGTAHWDAKTPRFWDIDFRKLSLLGPLPGADVADWPFAYADLASCYDEVEQLLGVQGDVTQLPADPTLRHAPRTKPLPMPPGTPQYSSLRLVHGARDIGLQPFPMPMAINSKPFGDRPACANCGFCCGYGCPSHARGSALLPLRRAVHRGTEVRTESTAVRVRHQGRKATGVTFVDRSGHERSERADLVVLACSSIETCRLALLSRLPDPAALIGHHIMFHWYSVAFGVFLGERVHAHRGRNITHAVDEFADPDFPGARGFAREAGLGHIRGGVVELGASPLGPIAEGLVYRRLLPRLGERKPYGRTFKALMRESFLRERLLGVQMHGEDVAQRENAVELDPSVRDWRGQPVARITYVPHRHELTSQRFFLPWLCRMLEAAGADLVAATPETRSAYYPEAPGAVPGNFHTLGGMRMGTDPHTSVTDTWGRLHHMDNVLVADGSVFPTAGGHNPTLTIMATALRNTRAAA